MRNYIKVFKRVEIGMKTQAHSLFRIESLYFSFFYNFWKRKETGKKNIILHYPDFDFGAVYTKTGCLGSTAKN